MSKEKLKAWLENKAAEGYAHFAHHKPDSLTTEEELHLLVRISSQECYANSLHYKSIRQTEEYDKILNVYYIPLNLSYLEPACKAPNVYTLISIYNFSAENDKIDIVDYNKLYPDHACSLITIKEVTENYTHLDYIERAWVAEVGNSSTRLAIYGDNNLQITDDHFIC